LRHSKEFIGETPGTFLLVLFGCGSVAVSVLFNAGLAIYVLFSPSVAAFENAHNIIRGSAESIQTATNQP